MRRSKYYILAVKRDTVREVATNMAIGATIAVVSWSIIIGLVAGFAFALERLG